MLVEEADSGTNDTIDITFKGARRHVVQLDRSDVRSDGGSFRDYRRRHSDGEIHAILYGSEIYRQQHHAWSESQLLSWPR